VNFPSSPYLSDGARWSRRERFFAQRDILLPFRGEKKRGEEVKDAPARWKISVKKEAQAWDPEKIPLRKNLIAKGLEDHVQHSASAIAVHRS